MTEPAAPLRRRSRVSAGDRVKRLLSIVPWIASHDGPTIDAICQRFSLSRAQLLEDLDVVFMVGLYPFTPDELIDVIIEDDRVFIRLAEFFAQPLRLTPDQALALVAAGASLTGVGDGTGQQPGDTPLARGLAKVAAVLGIDQEGALAVRLGEARPELLALLQQAVVERRRVNLEYYSYGRDQRSSRLVDPHRVYADTGQWYLDATCHQAGGERRFRVDRIERAEVTDQHFDPPNPAGQAAPGAPTAGVYQPAADDPRVVLELEPSAAWLVQHYPCEAVEMLAEGRIRVTMAISAVAWLERVLVRLGPEVTVVHADAPLDVQVGRRAAQRILDRYRAS
ncbi:MAG: helix-turn-helix transcriptional regulator [Acidimicrobiales bacterium]